MENILNRYKQKLDFDENKQSFSEIHNNQVTAFYYMADTTVNLDKDLTKVIDSIEVLQKLHKKSELIIKMNIDTDEDTQYISILKEINTSTSYLKQQFLYLKENIIKKDQFNNFLFWKYNLYIMNKIKLNHKKLEQMGLSTLQNQEKLYWRTSICNTQDEVFSLIVSLMSICKLEINFVEEYFPNKWNESSLEISTLKPLHRKYINSENSNRYKHKNVWMSVMDFFAGDTTISHL
ncbi:hypothetical protein K0U91_00870 [Chryseobacterium chendengshani]|uniref:hypothetical protein n=1 Tax=Chryseobacterium sp. LJ668 TaxID=2864040 RepID=UPI001C68D7A2|nr:hypothetical protein [Chryseobacterium sp. LJ668]MBW8523775.1 hypothetical protein [Chryseobacterium sp. LJ668]QYK16719.1 hypothetical protein K0U91_00870 [Chryseobacterium sp. LJ668]